MRFILPLFLSFILVSCVDSTPNLNDPKSATIGELSFSYPQNWKISGRDEASDFRSVFLDTSTGGIMIIKSYPLEDAKSLEELAKEFSACASGEMKFGKISAGHLVKSNDGNGEEWFSETFQMKILGQETEFKRLYGSKDHGDRRLFFILQETTESLAKAKLGFELSWKSVN